jgi:hypothetical protein
MCGARFAIYWVYLQTRHTFRATAALFPQEDEPSQPDEATPELNGDGIHRVPA